MSSLSMHRGTILGTSLASGQPYRINKISWLCFSVCGVCVYVCVCLKEKKKGWGVTSVHCPPTGGYMLFYNGVHYAA